MADIPTNIVKGSFGPLLSVLIQKCFPIFLQQEQTDNFPKLYVLDAFCLTIPSLSHFYLFTFCYKNPEGESHISTLCSEA